MILVDRWFAITNQINAWNKMMHWNLIAFSSKVNWGALEKNQRKSFSELMKFQRFKLLSDSA